MTDSSEHRLMKGVLSLFVEEGACQSVAASSLRAVYTVLSDNLTHSLWGPAHEYSINTLLFAGQPRDRGTPNPGTGGGLEGRHGEGGHHAGEGCLAGRLWHETPARRQAPRPVDEGAGPGRPGRQA